MDMQVSQKPYPGLLPANRMAVECVRDEYQCIGRLPYQESPFILKYIRLLCGLIFASLQLLISWSYAAVCWIQATPAILIFFFNLQRFSCYLFLFFFKRLLMLPNVLKYLRFQPSWAQTSIIVEWQNNSYQDKQFTQSPLRDGGADSELLIGRWEWNFKQQYSDLVMGRAKVGFSCGRKVFLLILISLLQCMIILNVCTHYFGPYTPS